MLRTMIERLKAVRLLTADHSSNSSTFNFINSGSLALLILNIGMNITKEINIVKIPRGAPTIKNVTKSISNGCERMMLGTELTKVIIPPAVVIESSVII